MRLTGPSSERPVASCSPTLAASSIAVLELVPDEAPDNDVLADPLDRVLQEVPDRLVGLLDVGLGEQGLLGLPLAHPALDNLGLYLLGLAHLGDLLVDDLALLLAGLGRDVLGRHDERLHGGNVQRHVADEPLEVVGAGNEVRLAVDLDEHAHAPVEVDVGVDEALGRLAGALLGRDGLAPLAQNLPGPLDVAVALLERPLHVHHASRGFLPQLLYLLYGASQSL